MSNRPHTQFSRGLGIAVAATTVLALTSSTGGSALATPRSAPAADTSARVGEYEPNDLITQATALGASGTTYTAAVETQSDIDMFEFYVAVHGSQVFFPITNTTQGATIYERIAAEIRDADGDVLTTTDYDGIDVGESETISYSLPAGRYYLVIDTEYSEKNFVRPYTFTLNGSTVDAATMQGICDQSKAQVSDAAKKVRRAKKALRRADSRREVRKARAKLKRAKRVLRAAERRSVTYCVVL